MALPGKSEVEDPGLSAGMRRWHEGMAILPGSCTNEAQQRQLLGFASS